VVAAGLAYLIYKGCERFQQGRKEERSGPDNGSDDLYDADQKTALYATGPKTSLSATNPKTDLFATDPRDGSRGVDY